MQPLFSPFEIKDIHLKNRIVMPALASFLIVDDGCISDATVELYRRRAGGGPAIVRFQDCAAFGRRRKRVGGVGGHVAAPVRFNRGLLG